MQEGQSGFTGVTLAEKVRVVLCPDTIGLVKGGFARVVGTDNPCSDASLA